MIFSARCRVPICLCLSRPIVGEGGGNRFETALKRFETAFRSLWAGVVRAWNEIELEEADVCNFNPLPTVVSANESSGGSGTITEDGDWTIPFGDYPGTAFRKNGEQFPIIQRVDAQAANEMAGGWKSWRQKLAIWIMKVPVYRGHPDKLADLTDEQKEAIQRGSLKSVTASDNKLHFAVALNEKGAADAAALKSFSPFWVLKDTGEKSPAGIGIWRPYLIYSVGITDRPVIKTAAINEEETNQENPKMNELIIKLRQELKLPADLSDEEVLKRGQEHYGKILDELWSVRSKLEESARLKTDAETAASKASADIASAKAEAAAANAVAESAKQIVAAANELKTKAEAALDAAITAGRILPADRAAWLDRFLSDPIATAVAAANEAPKLHTTESAAASANSRDVGGPLQQFQAAVAAHMNSTGCNYNTAWNACRKSHAAIYALLKNA